MLRDNNGGAHLLNQWMVIIVVLIRHFDEQTEKNPSVNLFSSKIMKQEE